MTYQQTIDYLYHAAPLFQNIGAGAYKEGLANTHALDERFGHPHTKYHTLHVAGTNGKGSVSSTLAAVLQSAGYKVGLYTSPHLVDFRERIRVNGEMIPEQRVVDFVEQERAFFEPLHPSFFELTTALAFLYFAEQGVDVAVVEVGLGGRLDCTNIIKPDLSIITNISFDHQQFLGPTLAAIAAEKAGIIKPGVPVLIGETNGHPEVREVFQHIFETVNASAASPSAVLRYADEEPLHTEVMSPLIEAETPVEAVPFELRGAYQRANARTILCALSELMTQQFYARIDAAAVLEGFAHVMELTGLRGRWQQLRKSPLMVCDAGHNEAGIQSVVSQLLEQRCKRLHVVIGMVGDKDYSAAARAFVRLAASRAAQSMNTHFYLTQPSCQRALPAGTLASAFAEAASGQEALAAVAASSVQLYKVCTFLSVSDAVHAALAAAAPEDMIFVGGSCYVVADLLSEFE